jgi:5-methyltetrahydrofolate--homocysteine methyltransferase
MRPLIDELAQIAPIYVSCHPNAGLPDPLLPTGFPETPESLAPQLREWADNGWLNIVGGCCGTTPAQSRRRGGQRVTPRRCPVNFAFERLVPTRPESNFVNIGERTNVTGRRFARWSLGDFEKR